MPNCGICKQLTPKHYELANICEQNGIQIQEVSIGLLDGVLHYPLPEHKAVMTQKQNKTPAYILSTPENTWMLPVISVHSEESFQDFVEQLKMLIE